MTDKLTVVDDNDNPIRIASKEDIVKNKWNYRCTHIYVFNSKGELLIAKRPDFKKRFPGKWTCGAGGKVDADEPYDICAKRELQEELGVDLELSFHNDFVYTSEFDYKVFHKLYTANYEGPFAPADDEICELSWANINELEKDMQLNPDKYAQPFLDSFRSYISTLDLEK